MENFSQVFFFFLNKVVNQFWFSQGRNCTLISAAMSSPNRDIMILDGLFLLDIGDIPSANQNSVYAMYNGKDN